MDDREPPDIAVLLDHVHGAPVRQLRHHQPCDAQERRMVIQREGEDLARLGQEALYVLVLLPAGDVALHPDEPDQTSLLVEDRQDRQLVPEERPIFFVVPYHHPALSALPQRNPQLAKGQLVAVFSLQETAVAPHALLKGVAGHPLKGRVDVDDGGVGQVRVGDHDAVGVGERRHPGRKAGATASFTPVAPALGTPA